MKIISFKKPITFQDGSVVVNDLAYNHSYKKENQFLVVEGKDKVSGKTYKAFYSLKGEFLFIKLREISRRKMLVCWREEHEDNVVEILDKDGNSLVVSSLYITTNTISNKLVKKSFCSHINGEKSEKTFTLNGKKWTVAGDFSRKHFIYWCK